MIFFLCLKPEWAIAVDGANLEIGSIKGSGWKLEGLNLEVSNLSHENKGFRAKVAKLMLPKPFNELTLAGIHCRQFIWRKEEISCLEGRASVRSPYWQTVNADFSFRLSNKTKNTIKLDGITLAGSYLSLAGEMAGQDWRLRLTAQRAGYPLLDKLLRVLPPGLKLPEIKQGVIDMDAAISGRSETPSAIELNAKVRNLTGQTRDGRLAAEKLETLVSLTATKLRNDWLWQSETKFLKGALYAEPVYLEAGAQPIVLKAGGVFNAEGMQTNLDYFRYLHPGAMELSGRANVAYRNKFEVRSADVSLHSETLQGLFSTYLAPFFTESPLEGLTASGCLNAKLSIEGESIKSVHADFKTINLNDGGAKLGLKNAWGSVNWNANPALTGRSELQWQQLMLKNLPFNAANITVNSRGNYFDLADKVNLPVLDGIIFIDKFSFHAKQNNEPDVAFAGSINHVSLEKLAKALSWTPLSGNISGVIPGVKYRNKTLSLDGELLVDVFGGMIRINNLSSKGLFSDFPTMKIDIAIENLDLEQLTKKFEFGNITGKLTGFVNNLVLENWRPAGFYAWLGTPDDDDSKHTISQKAVNNIASIGGGGATDLISRSFLGFFETFRYDKIGVGCYLHNGVCQMSGVEPAERGYYLIKGGCLPRIDVLGYNTEVNWEVLVERLARVANPDKAIIK